VAQLLKINRKTVVRKFRFLSKIGVIENAKLIKSQYQGSLKLIQFDDLETSEHTKCKPLSVALAVDPTTRIILGFKVSQMPAKGHLAEIARKKYGYRPDHRSEGWSDFMLSLKPIAHPNAKFTSDENPHYPALIKKHFPESQHVTVKGKRGSLSGQGELKKIGFDPIFALNHTCAMLRANMNRLLRRTWCTTKNKQGLIDHLSLYVNYHNRLLAQKSAGWGGSLEILRAGADEAQSASITRKFRIGVGAVGDSGFEFIFYTIW
jgi:hypothetical protein